VAYISLRRKTDLTQSFESKIIVKSKSENLSTKKGTHSLCKSDAREPRLLPLCQIGIKDEQKCIKGQNCNSPVQRALRTERSVEASPHLPSQVNRHKDGVRRSQGGGQGRIRSTHPPEEVHFILECIVGHLEVEQSRFQLAPMGNARLNTEIR
jgi:hypothetical protein